MLQGTRVWFLVGLGLLAHYTARAQIDPVQRRLIELGYNQPLQGRSPIAAYGFYYHNQPGFYSTNLTLRLALSPIYVDGELGVAQLLGPNTDMGFGLAGGGYADSYSEIRQGVYETKESFWGDAVEASSSLYHLFNPKARIPLYLVLRASVRESFFRRDTDTAENFKVPDDLTTFHFRSGLRFGGKEPSLTEPLAMELSLWHEAQVRLNSERYGFNEDREIKPQSHLLWVRALAKYTTDPGEQSIELALTAGTSWNTDRFSAYRLGGLLPFTSEFPLSIPGYFYQELSSDQFALLNAHYSLPLPVGNKNWRFELVGSTGFVDYLAGLEQPGHWHTGAGSGITYISPSGSWIATLLYAHGFDAMRSHGRGADQISFVFQYDFEAKALRRTRFFVPESSPYRSPGVERMIR